MIVSFKKIAALFLLVSMLFTMSIIFNGCVIESSDTDAKSTTEKPKDSASKDDSLGKYGLEIKSCRLAKDYEGKSIVIVKYVFTNNDDEAAAFYLTFDDKVYQNGVGLNECYFADDSANYSSDNQTKEIKKGSSIEVEVAYKLNDNTTDVEVEVSELFSLSKKEIKKVFKIAS